MYSLPYVVFCLKDVLNTNISVMSPQSHISYHTKDVSQYFFGIVELPLLVLKV